MKLSDIAGSEADKKSKPEPERKSVPFSAKKSGKRAKKTLSSSSSSDEKENRSRSRQKRMLSTRH